ncbi:MAG: hypothetical protein H6622_05115 [Halobacteriovoraceae bacterium]|nr:hypothetical protein [Halobacteriovoraceae bacterium]
MKQFIFYFFIISNCFANPFSIGNRSYGTSNTTIIAQIDSLFDQLEDDINSKLPDADQSSYLKGMANANLMAAKLVTSEYYNDIEIGQFRYHFSAGADIGENSMKDVLEGNIDPEQLRGASFLRGLTFGVSLETFGSSNTGIFDPKKTDLFLHFNNTDMKIDNLTIKSTSFGFMIRSLIGEGGDLIPFGTLRFNGVYLASGLEYHSMILKLLLDLNVSQNISGLGTATISGDVQAGVDVSTYSIPIEIGTSFQWLYVMTTMMGIGLDFNFGSAESLASSSALLSTDVSGASGTADIDLGSKDVPSPVLFRWFLGQQIQLSVAKFSLNVTHVPWRGHWGINLSGAISY